MTEPLPDAKTPSELPPPKGRLLRYAMIGLVLLCLGAGGGLYALHTCPWLSQRISATSDVSAHADVARLGAELNALRQRVEALEAQGRQPTSETATQSQPVPQQAPLADKDVVRLQDDVASLSSSLAEVKSAVKQTSDASSQASTLTQSLLAAALAFIPLRDAVLSGHAYVDELAGFRVTAGKLSLGDELAKLDAFAPSGAPTFAALREGLIDHEAEALHAVDRAEATGWWQRVMAELRRVVSIRPLHGEASTDAFAAIESRLGAGDAAGALDAFKALPPAAQQNLADWRSGLEARQKLDGALQNIIARLLAAAQGTP